MNKERGFALVLVLILLGLGGLIITPALSLADTALRSRAVFAKDILNDYAADSAIEYSMWQLKWQPGFAASLPIGVESPPACITVNGVSVCTTIVAQAPIGQLSGQPLAGPASNLFFKVTKLVLPSTAQPGVLTDFTYYVTIQCLDPNGCTDITPLNQALERIEDCLPAGITYVAGSVDLYPVLFSDDFQRADNNTVSGWTDSDGGGNSARNVNNEVRLRLGASITKSAISTVSYTGIFLTYIWRGDPDAEVTDTLVVEWKPSSSGTWTTLATHLLTTTSWQNATFTLPASADNTTIDIRFTANTDQSNEEARLDDVMVRSNVPVQGGLWDAVDWGVAPFEPTQAYDSGNCSNRWRLRWDFTPNIAFDYGQVRTMGFKARGTLAQGVYCNRISVLPDTNNMRPGGTAKITVGDPAETRCSGGLLAVGKSSDTPVVYPEVPTTITYTITIKNVDTIPININRVEDYLPTTGMADPTFQYVANSAHGFIDRQSTPLLFNDNFQRNDSNTVLYWTDSDGAGSNARVNNNEGYLRLGASITRSPISTVGYTGIVVAYQWTGDEDAESTDTLVAEWKPSSIGTWTTLATHLLNTTSSQTPSFTLPASADNAAIDIRFRASTDQSNEEARLDNVKVTSNVPIPTTPICLPDQNQNNPFLVKNWFGSPFYRWELEWRFNDYPNSADPIWNPGGLCGQDGLAGGALRPLGGYEWANYDPVVLNPGETLTILFQAVVTLTASGSYYNEVFVRLESDINGTEQLYSWPVAGVTVPQYDMQATTLMSILRANTFLTSDGAWKRSQHWKKHR